jgi:integrase
VVLRMPSLTKRKGSDNWYYRRTIPADILRILAKLPRAKWPLNWYRTHISISLGTADRSAAKAKCPDVAATIERQMKALREGPKPLTVKQIAALSGELYKGFAEGLEADPILTADQWRDIAEGNRETAQGKYSLGIYKNDAERQQAAMAKRFGRIADALLTRHHLITDDQSRWRLIERLSADLPKAAEKLSRNADGDFSPDTYAQRFPAWEAPDTSDASKRSLSGLAEAWREAAIARKVSPRGAKLMSRVVLRFAKWLGHDDTHRVTRQDVLNWTDARLKDGIEASTINKTDTAALQTIFGWGADRGWMRDNPLARPVRIESRGKPVVREKFFSHKEASAILKAALAVQPTKREASKTTAAKRWVPWLCAYSGARVSEMIQVRKHDIRLEQGAWIIRLSPDAGSIKTNAFRDVPVHEHLLAIGFIEFVQASPAGPLFARAGKDGTTTGSAEGVYSRSKP